MGSCTVLKHHGSIVQFKDVKVEVMRFLFVFLKMLKFDEMAWKTSVTDVEY